MASLGGLAFYVVFLPILLIGAVLATTRVARADNSPEAAQRRVEENVLPKIVHSCGGSLTIVYDGPSLSKYNTYIAHHQTDGRTECDEPLRYLWYACKSAAGRAAVKVARLSRIVCKGTPGTTGSLTLSSGTMTTATAFEEKDPYLRTRKQFEALLKVSLPLESADPYQDQSWRDLEGQPNPVTSTQTYCTTNGEKVQFDERLPDGNARRRLDGVVKCWKDGEVVIDVRIISGRKTGFIMESRGQGGSRRVSYQDDKQHGEEKFVQNGKVTSVASYEAGVRVSRREFRPTGKLSSYWRKFEHGVGELGFREDGTIHRLGCVPEARDDADLRKWCGFEGATTTAIYDGTGKVARVQTWKDGVLQKEAPGDSNYSVRSEVSFKDGKKHGVERIFTRAGKLESTISWDIGTKEGKEIAYAEDGKKVTKETVWKGGEIQQLTEFYLNGNPKRTERYQDQKKREAKAFWDSGKVSQEGQEQICETVEYGFRSRRWCEEGLHRSYFEDGTLAGEIIFRAGKRHGTSKSWWPNRQQASIEDYADGNRTRAKLWDKDGKLLSDEEFEADGSRKLKR